MNRLQKIAWYNLIIIATSCVLSGAAVGALATIVGIPRALGGLGLMGICGLMGFSPILFREKRNQVGFDERDQLIQKKAMLIAYSTFWICFVSACMIPWSIIGPSGSISVNALPSIVLGGFIILMLVQSVAILVQYGWTCKGEKS